MHALGHMNPAVYIGIGPEQTDWMVTVNNTVSLARVNWWGSRVKVWRGFLPSTLCPPGPEGVRKYPKTKKAAQLRLPARAVQGLSSSAQPGMADLAAGGLLGQ